MGRFAVAAACEEAADAPEPLCQRDLRDNEVEVQRDVHFLATDDETADEDAEHHSPVHREPVGAEHVPRVRGQVLDVGYDERQFRAEQTSEQAPDGGAEDEFSVESPAFRSPLRDEDGEQGAEADHEPVAVTDDIPHLKEDWMHTAPPANELRLL